MEVKGFLVEMAAILLLALLVVDCLESDSNLTVKVRGLVVEYREGVIDCDSVICPPETAICRVTKNSIPNDEVPYFYRHIRCVDASGNIIKEQKQPEPDGIDNKTITLSMKADGTFNIY